MPHLGGTLDVEVINGNSHGSKLKDQASGCRWGKYFTRMLKVRALSGLPPTSNASTAPEQFRTKGLSFLSSD